MIPVALAAAVSGLLFSLSFPPTNFHLLAWISFVPLFWGLNKDPGPHSAAFCGFYFGLVFFALDASWIFPTLVVHGHFAFVSAFLLFVTMVATLALFPAAFGFLVALFSRRGHSLVAISPVVWTATEYLRSVALTGFPWDLAGYSQADTLMVIQVVDITGIYGVSFLVILVNACVWELAQAAHAFKRPNWKALAATFATIVLVLAYGKIRLDHFPSHSASSADFAVGILQGNVAQEIKWDENARNLTFRVYEELGKKAVEEGAKLLLWPETAVPVLFGSPSLEWRRAGFISEKLGVPMVVGAPSAKLVKGRIHYFNSALLVNGPAVQSRYDKIHLVPFGEYMPLSWLLPIGPGMAAREADYSPGDTISVMHVDGCPPFSVLICYEAIFPELSRWALRSGARMLTNITNDGWFLDTPAPYQHLAMARTRAVENRAWLLRCANTGISAAFDPGGRMVNSLALNQRGVLVIHVPPSPASGSFYTRFGDIFVWGCLGVLLILFLSITWETLRRRVGNAHVHAD